MRNFLKNGPIECSIYNEMVGLFYEICIYFINIKEQISFRNITLTNPSIRCTKQIMLFLKDYFQPPQEEETRKLLNLRYWQVSIKSIQTLLYY